MSAYPLVQMYSHENGSSLTAQTTFAIRDGRYADALTHLQELRESKHIPKLGALQRWARDCMNEEEFASLEKEEAIVLLDAVRSSSPRINCSLLHY